MRAIIGALVASLGAGVASAGTLEDQLFQMRLVREGVFIGNTDGQIGPATRKAMNEYAKKFNVINSEEAIRIDMMRRAEDARESPVPQELWDVAVVSVKHDLADPFSAQFRPLFYFSGSDGNKVVCGLVNAKNLYGAYVGDQFFMSDIVPLSTGGYGFARLDGADRYCAYGVSFEDIITRDLPRRSLP